MFLRVPLELSSLLERIQYFGVCTASCWSGESWFCPYVIQFILVGHISGPIFLILCFASTWLSIVVTFALYLLLICRWQSLKGLYVFGASCFMCFSGDYFSYAVISAPTIIWASYGDEVFYTILLWFLVGVIPWTFRPTTLIPNVLVLFITTLI